MLNIIETANPDCALVTDKHRNGEHVIETLLVQPYGTTVTISETVAAITENMKTVPVNAALTFAESSPWCIPIPETAHRVGIYFNFVLAEPSLPEAADTFTVYAFLLGCIKTGTTIIPVTVLNPINTLKPAWVGTVFSYPKEQSACMYDNAEPMIPTHLISAEIPAGISHITVIKRMKNITVNPLPESVVTLKTSVHFW